VAPRMLTLQGLEHVDSSDSTEISQLIVRSVRIARRLPNLLLVCLL